ncbi:MAG: hypothetical protein JWQ12_1702 [Glaciihabitans sp.]|nr:hypothetical protein [Glaciihabitans sp.]
MTAPRPRLSVEYILPLRWNNDDDLLGLAVYLEQLIGEVDVTVVDGSPEPLRSTHARVLPAGVRIITPDWSLGSNGKAAAVLTAAPLCRHDRVIIADDDVRYTAEGLADVALRLESADLVRPQNYFSTLPWHARWDTGRTLLNRAFSSDFPGTLGVRTSRLAAGYDGDVLFENLELIRTVTAAGGIESRADDLYIARRAPTIRAFLSQRVRQAYDSFAQPARLAVELSIVPLVFWASRRPARTLVMAAAIVAVAEKGRRRAGGSAVFPASTALWAPLWVLERGVCAWLALAARARGGVLYRGNRMRRAANSTRSLARARGNHA